MVCQSLPVRTNLFFFFFFFLRTNLNWKDETEECILRVVRSPGSGHQEVWVLPLTLPATYQGHLPRVPVFLPSHHPMLSLKQLSKCFNVSLPCGLLCPRGLSRQEYWSELPCSPPGDLPNPGIEPGSSALQADSLPSEPPGKLKNP